MLIMLGGGGGGPVPRCAGCSRTCSCPLYTLHSAALTHRQPPVTSNTPQHSTPQPPTQSAPFYTILLHFPAASNRNGWRDPSKYETGMADSASCQQYIGLSPSEVATTFLTVLPLLLLYVDTYISILVMSWSAAVQMFAALADGIFIEDRNWQRRKMF